MESVLALIAAGDEWPQEPDGFHNIKFGSRKEDAERFVTFDHYGFIGGGWGTNLDTAYPTLGITHFSLGGAEITASLIFTPGDGCHCFEGTFPAEQFDIVKSSFVSMYGQPHEVEHLDHYEAKVESLLWYGTEVYIHLVSRDLERTNGFFLVANYSYMWDRSGGKKMREKAKRKLASYPQEVYTPPGGWAEEPDDFNGLKLGMTKEEAERHVSFGKYTVTTPEIPGFPTREHFVYDTTLHVAGLAIPGGVLFVEDRLIHFGGKFHKSHWNAVKSAFIERYGRPHCDRREMFERGLDQTLEWHGERVSIRLLDFPDGENLGRFVFQGTLKGAKIGLEVELKTLRSPPKIEIEHTDDPDNAGVPSPLPACLPHHPPMAVKLPLPEEDGSL
jgi:hypothetical protein